MQHFIIGTAGHIDHGKTSLLKAITDINCDTHPEEKKRGITINLGFAYLKTPDDKFLAFIDVPGHHKFISNMISGASGIDFVMLIVAADDGVMPQTIEHLKICSLLGIKNGIVVINKKDLADEEQLELVQEEISEFVEGTFLEDKPVFAVSAQTKEGIPELKDYLLKQDYELALREKQDYFRMYVDRVFNVEGFGAVTTGTVLAESVAVNDSLNILPANKEVRVRQIQRHGETVELAPQGTRVAINLTGVKKRDVNLGDILTKFPLPQSDKIDVKISLLEDAGEISDRFDAILLIGTNKMSVKVKILGADPEKEGEVFAQIYFGHEWYFVKGDHFILRNSSSNMTIGGGEVIDPLPLNHKKKSEKLLSSLIYIAASKLSYMEKKTKENVSFTDLEYFEKTLQLKEEKILDIIAQSEEITVLKSKLGNSFVVDKKVYVKFRDEFIKQLTKYHKTNPLSIHGVSKKKIADFIKDIKPYRDPASNEQYLNIVMDSLEDEGKIERYQNNWKLAGQRTSLNENEKAQIASIEGLMKDVGLSNIDLEDLEWEAKQEGIDQRTFKYIVKYLTETNRIVRLGGICYYAKTLNSARTQLVDHLKTNPDGITVATFRDILGANRKITLQMFEIFEGEKIVYRDGDLRKLRL